MSAAFWKVFELAISVWENILLLEFCMDFMQQKPRGKKGKVLWGNSILYSSRVPLSAGHSDDVSLMDDPAKGWGWLADKGFDIIQTDWTQHCSDYLIEKGVRKGGVWNFSF